MKYGLKLWSTNYNLIGEASKLIENKIFNYIELMPVPSTDIVPYKKMGVPFIIHTTTEKYGFNISDPNKQALNKQILNSSIRWADELNADYIIVHPGYGSLDDTIAFLETVKDNRILIENMPTAGMNGEKMVGCTYDQLKVLMSNNFGLCLDFSHAIKAALDLKIDCRSFVETFLTLNPKVFHISDGRMNNIQDEHLHFGEGDFAIDFLLRCMTKCCSPLLTLETSRSFNSFKEDLKNLGFLKKIKTF